ncbi:uncharacterized protein RCC_03560 [Ramularia collo-cygni]|uniref:Uncharacterized protein n=1 Tax=Ramularia collo-cygni TaxID=112498 RepID=A0A2D3VB73_9PEZI|nr:uncharacterized protein RCC_03560 [Ramularia collo-cygni]CZT17723.1 uncharacterized protein RCC_03560 [Ramularia collo-cygni]
MLIRSGAFVDARSSPTGLTPLSYAATFGHMECIRVLLAHGASTNIKAVGGDAPLHLAAQKGHLESLKLLLDKGAARDDTTSSGCTALHCAVSGGWKECVEILLASGASTNIRNHYGDLASHIAARQGHLECLKCLLNGNKNNLLDGRGRRGCNPLMVAISNGHTTCAELLLGKGADPSLAEDRGRSAIHFARDEACVRILARHDTSMMTLQDHVGSTLLMISAAHGRQAVVQKLLDLEAPMIHQTDRKGFNAFDHAKGQEHKGIVELLTRHGARPTSRATRPLSNDTILHTSSGATQHKVSLGLTTSQRNPSIYTRRLAYYSPPLYTYRSTRQVYSTESETAPMK